jgi:hypothetical protein
MTPSIVLPQPLAPYPSSHPILNVYITNYVKFQVTSVGEHFSKWRQILTFLLTMYQALDHITEGAAPVVPDDLWMAVDIHISFWFMATLSDDLYRVVSDGNGRACSTWSRLTRFFLDNKASRYLFLSKAFRSMIRLKHIYNFLCSMLVYASFTLCFVYTSWRFYAFSRTNLLTRCHSASFLFLLFLCFRKVTQKIFLELDETKAEVPNYLTRRRSPKESRRRTRGQPHPVVARASPRPRHQGV